VQLAGMNSMLKIYAILLLISVNPFSVILKAQTYDTLRVMSYNLTNYGNTIDGCVNATNGPALKNPEFKNIIKHVLPDVLGVCEMNTNPTLANNFLNNVLNTDGVTHYKRSNQQAETSGTITSILYYDSEKLVLANQSFAATSPRLTHHFRLYLKTNELQNGDTIWINVLACHLKAGSTASDATDRANSAATIRTYLNSFSKTENCLMMGDFNVYRSSEVAFQNLTAAGTRPAYQFLDPVNRVGSWGSNASFADVHSQCPSLGYNPGCYSGGGLDDRLDFILMNRHALYDSSGLRYLTGTYKALGNDGLHYNKNITDSPINNSVPSAVLQSLYKASDHLPIVTRLRVKGSFITGLSSVIQKRTFALQLLENFFLVSGLEDGISVALQFSDASGKILWTGEEVVRDSALDLPQFNCPKGLIFVRAIAENKYYSTSKFLKFKP